MKLFLDDVRTPPGVGWTVVKTVNDAIEILKRNKELNITFEYASLDHDLVDGHYPWNQPIPYPENPVIVAKTGEKTGFDLVAWMCDNSIWPTKGIAVHSQNNDGRSRMLELICNHCSCTVW